jgi:hypothetical protein
MVPFPSPPPIPHVPHPHPIFSFSITPTNKNNVNCMVFETILPSPSYVLSVLLSVHVLTVQQDISLLLHQQ